MKKQQAPAPRHLLHHVIVVVAVVALLVVTGLCIVRLLMWSQKTDVSANGSAIFSQTSFWNTRLPRYTPESPGASAVRQALMNQASSSLLSEGARFYSVLANADVVDVELRDCETGVIIGPIDMWRNVPIPASAAPSSGREMIVYQPSSQTVWEFGDMEQIAGGWRACSGGRITQTGSSDGVYVSPYGVTTSGIARSGGLIRQNELQSGYINHVIGLSMPTNTNSYWPANRSSGSGSIPAGTRMRLDPSFGINTLPPVERAIARAAQQYGFVVWDHAPVPTVHAELSSDMTLNGFPWDKLQILPAHYGQNGITPSITSFVTSAATVENGGTVSFNWEATNVDSCTIPSVFSGQPATGNWQTAPLAYSTNFSLVCGGVAGSASRQVSVGVSVANGNTPPPTLPEGVIIAMPPVAGQLNILPEFISLTEIERIYKVEYYKQARLIDNAIVSPYGFDTTTLPDGEHQLELRIYYRGGDSKTEQRRVKIANNDERLVFADAMPPPNRLSRTLAGSGLLLALVIVMFLAIRHGQRLASTK